MTLRVSCVCCVLWLLATATSAQSPAPSPDRAGTEAMARRVAERVRALQREADRLAGEARTLVGDLRRLEIERNLATERMRAAESAVAAVEMDLHALAARLAALERTRTDNLPDLRSRFVELYKRGPDSYARMLAGVRDLREFGRATRAVSSLVATNKRRIEEHRRTLESMRKERVLLQTKTRELEAKRLDAQKARAAAERALNARAALLASIDARRDLNAQFAGELMVAQQKLQTALASMKTGQAVEPISVPISPFRSALDWPVVGPIASRFAPSHGSTTGVRNGIEIEAPEGTAVRAVHPGTVGFADAFTGYGTLVIVDHGSDHYSLYGYLSSVTVERGDRLQAGQELGKTGLSPAGPPALYFEMRVDGRSVDPVQWLRKR